MLTSDLSFLPSMMQRTQTSGSREAAGGGVGALPSAESLHRSYDREMNRDGGGGAGSRSSGDGGGGSGGSSASSKEWPAWEVSLPSTQW